MYFKGELVFLVRSLYLSDPSVNMTPLRKKKKQHPYSVSHKLIVSVFSVMENQKLTYCM